MPGGEIKLQVPCRGDGAAQVGSKTSRPISRGLLKGLRDWALILGGGMYARNALGESYVEWEERGSNSRHQDFQAIQSARNIVMKYYGDRSLRRRIVFRKWPQATANNRGEVRISKERFRSHSVVFASHLIGSVDRTWEWVGG